jgi:hypothetical protein
MSSAIFDPDFAIYHAALPALHARAPSHAVSNTLGGAGFGPVKSK